MNEDEKFEEYNKCTSVVDHLLEWKSTLEKRVFENPKDIEAHGLIAEVELSILRLKLLAGTEIFSKKSEIYRLEYTPDHYNYRLMCEWGYRDQRENWVDAEENGKRIPVDEGFYVIKP